MLQTTSAISNLKCKSKTLLVIIPSALLFLFTTIVNAQENTRTENWRARNVKWIAEDANSKTRWRQSNEKWLKSDGEEKNNNWRMRNSGWITQDSSAETRWRKSNDKWLKEDAKLIF